MDESDKFCPPPRLTATPRQVKRVTQPFWEIKMSEELNHNRRRFLRNATVAFAAAEVATIGSADAQSSQTSPAPMPQNRLGTNASFGSLKTVNAGVLSIAYAEVGPADGPPVLLLHGWPYDIHSFVDVAPIFANAGYRVHIPYFAWLRRDAVSLVGHAAQRPARGGRHRCYQLPRCAQHPEGRRCGIRLGRQNCDLMAFLWPERCKALVSVSGYSVETAIQALREQSDAIRADIDHMNDSAFCTVQSIGEAYGLWRRNGDEALSQLALEMPESKQFSVRPRNLKE
jgi:hypothetical protein